MRRLEEGRIYHIHDRVGGGLLPFLDEGLAMRSGVARGPGGCRGGAWVDRPKRTS